MAVLVTGGAGYIGSHTCVELLNAGKDVVIVDNFYNCKRSSLDRIRALVKKDFKFYECDIRDKKGLDEVFKKEQIDSVIHFAGLKAVGESVHKPLEYFDNNVNGTLVLLEVMRENGCKKIVFSSSATVYGMNNVSPLTEDMEVGGVTNPYGRTKYMIECILKDLYVSDDTWSICLLRYFNPIGAHKSGTMGEDPNGIPNNLMPYITQVAIGKREFLNVWGDDYDTPDGTGVRDYIHVVDLALGHIKAVEKVEGCNGLFIYNLGTGKGYSVLDVVKAFEKASGVEIPYKIGPRRDGDIATCYSDPSKAFKELGWKAERDIEEMCEDSWRWQKQNPNGYPD
ncbi:MAG TPA: UDP-glucose 4-epimerase GalE [Candidatus Eubacterium faecipullorum]|uniref:UDP-glucose 4-epimerase n=1 Tax=Candidatus Eubacterium faecipullorum TaxID=2838571 RepID=A0A9D1RD63_9FIRM|nr:UDP-glucose 4-epimerase GalE [Candidatus Eubacterium faecipullorum]